VILGTIISVFLFDFVLTAQFVWGAALVIFSAYLYGTPPSPLTPPPSHHHPHTTTLTPPSHHPHTALTPPPHPTPSPHPLTPTPPGCAGRAAMQGDGTSEDSATSAVRCRDSFVNCLAFLDCFSDAHSARGKARRPRLLPTPCPTRTHARARAHTHRTARLPARPRARTPARPHARTPAMSHLTSEAVERGGGPRSCWAPGRGAPKQVRVPADSPGPYTDRLRTTSRSLAEDRQERAARRLTRATSSSTRPNCSASRHDGVHGAITFSYTFRTDGRRIPSTPIR
jgi:hypothetical protein